jgi:hypothetical protein
MRKARCVAAQGRRADERLAALELRRFRKSDRVRWYREYTKIVSASPMISKRRKVNERLPSLRVKT